MEPSAGCVAARVPTPSITRSAGMTTGLRTSGQSTIGGGRIVTGSRAATKATQHSGRFELKARWRWRIIQAYCENAVTACSVRWTAQVSCCGAHWETVHVFADSEGEAHEAARRVFRTGNVQMLHNGLDEGHKVLSFVEPW